MSYRTFAFALAVAVGMATVAHAQRGGCEPVGDMSSVESALDIQYAVVDGHELFLDLYLPEGVENPPLLVFVHGGAWRAGARHPVSSVALVNGGYAMASIDYRLSGDAPFPAQIHDIKAAIRFLRANEERLGYDASRIGIFGESAGAHLAALAGTTNGEEFHEGTVGNHLGESSDVAVVVSYFGASNLTSILDQSTPFGVNLRVPSLTALFGGTPEEKPELARAASPVFYVDASDPPLFLLHGDQDPQMPINQSHELHGAYKKAGLDTQFEVVHGARHGGPMFLDAERTALVLEFLGRHLPPGR